ncbi:MAG: sporulation protein YqfD [Clostridium sp.]|nr:sporulation protein YqfD [Clostridium sp.]
MKSDKFNKGIIILEVSVLSPERFLNVLWNKNIKISKVKKIDITTIRFQVNYEYYDEICEIVIRFQGKCRIISEKGLVFLFKKIKKRASLIVGLLMFLFGLYILSTYIWSIQIDTKKNISPYEIRKVLTELGVSPGIKKKDLNVYSLEKEVESINKDILWIRARIEGSTLKVIIEEKVTPPVIKEDGGGDCIAKMDGEIKRIYVSNGTAKVSPGDMVKEGDVLISSIQGREGDEYSVHAKGKVIANTFYEKQMEILIKGKKIESTGRKDKDIYINFWGNKIYLKKAINNFKYYDRIKEENNFVSKVTYFERDEKDVDLDKNKEIEDGKAMLENSLLKDLSNEAKIVDRNVETQDLGDGRIRLKVIFVVEQNIILNS